MISLPKNFDPARIQQYLRDLVSTLENQINGGPQVYVVDKLKNKQYPRNPRRRDILFRIKEQDGSDKIKLYWYDGSSWQPLVLSGIDGTLTGDQIDLSFLELNDTPDLYTGFGRQVVVVNEAENALEFTHSSNFLPSQASHAGEALFTNGSSLYWDAVSVGSSSFLDLTDTPNSYVGHASGLVRVNGSANALEFVDNINDYLPDQTGLGGYRLATDGAGELSWQPDLVVVTFLGLNDVPNAYNEYQGLVSVNAAVNGVEFIPADASIPQNARVRVRKDSSATKYLRRGLNLIPGTGVDITIADDNTDEEVDITIASTVSGGATTFLGLSDTANAYNQYEGLVRVNSSVDGLEFIPADASIPQNARVGVRYNSGGSTYLRRRINFIPGTNVTISVSDSSANEEVNVTINASSTTPTMTKVNSSAYEASRVIKNSSGNLRLVYGYNSKASAQFIQLHDASAVPADTAVPVSTITVDAQKSFSIACDNGIPFTNGIVVCNSSTGPTKTIGSADCYFTAVFD